MIAPARGRDGDEPGLDGIFINLDEPPGEASPSEAPWGDDDEAPP